METESRADSVFAHKAAENDVEHFLEIAILSVVQGLTEFLPVSSSGHLVVCKNILGMNTPGADLEVALHAGTLFSVLVYYRKTIAGLFAGLFRGNAAEWRRALALCVSAIPAVAVYFSLKTVFKFDLEDFFGDSSRVWMTGLFLCGTGALLISTRFMRAGARRVDCACGFAMGCAQAVALLPGVSRSGTTLFAARAAGAEAGDAAAFSFLMCAPLIAGAALMKAVSPSVPEPGCVAAGTAETLAGMSIAAVTGYFALALLVKSLKGGGFWLFGIYCMAAGAAVAAFA